MIHYISINTGSNPALYDTFTDKKITVEGRARTALRNYINEHNITDVVSIHESQLPNRNQIICWYYVNDNCNQPIRASTEQLPHNSDPPTISSGESL